MDTSYRRGWRNERPTQMIRRRSFLMKGPLLTHACNKNKKILVFKKRKNLKHFKQKFFYTDSKYC